MPKDALIAKFKDLVQQHNDATRYETLQANNSNFMPYGKVPHFLSNELDVASGQQMLQKLTPRRTEETVSVAILTGEAFVLSRLPELARHVDVVLLADLNPVLHAHNVFMLNTMKASPTLEAFLNAYLDDDANPMLAGKFQTTSMQVITAAGDYQKKDQPTLITREILASTLKSTQTSLPGLNFMATEARYQACRTALQSLQVCNLRWDWIAPQLAQQFMNRLGDLPVRIEFCHLSNVPDYDGNFPLRELLKKNQPWHYQGHVTQVLKTILVNSPNALIQFSHDLLTTQHNHLHCFIANSIDEFEQHLVVHEREANTQFTDDHEFKPVIDKLQSILAQATNPQFPPFEWRVATLKDQPCTLILQSREFFKERDQAVFVAKYLKTNGWSAVNLLREPSPTGANFYLLIPDVCQFLPKPTAAPAVSTPPPSGPSSSASSSSK